MLKQLDRLTMEADGRYATESELQFLKNYLQSVDSRISCYEKIRDASEDIIDRVKAEKNACNQENGDTLFYLGVEDRADTCIRDMKGVLRCGAAAILINDPERMRDAVLLWYYTIVRAFNYARDTQTIYPVLEKIVNSYLTPEEQQLAKPILKLNYTILKE